MKFRHTNHKPWYADLLTKFVFWVEANKDPWGLVIGTLHICLNSGFLLKDRFFILVITFLMPTSWMREEIWQYCLYCCMLHWFTLGVAGFWAALALLAAPLSQCSSYALFSSTANAAGRHECITTRGTEAHCQVLLSILNCPSYSWYPERPRIVGRMSLSSSASLPSLSTTSALTLLSFCCCCY